jgi:hypothetical protein
MRCNWSDAREEAIVQQHLISIGRRSAIARVAHLLLELGARLKLVGLADDDGYTCPLSQELLGDALGLTKIHVNRMLRELRELGCLTFRNGRVTFGDMARLIELAEYDAAYLDLQPRAGPAAPACRPSRRTSSVMARLDRATQQATAPLVTTGSPGLACGSPEDDKRSRRSPVGPQAGRRDAAAASRPITPCSRIHSA